MHVTVIVYSQWKQSLSELMFTVHSVRHWRTTARQLCSQSP